MEALQLSREVAVRRLQDVAAEYDQLPRRVRLSAITERQFAGCGGEAVIWTAKLRGVPVVSRECRPPEDGGWEDQDGQQILKVCLHNENKNAVKTTSAFRLSAEK